MRSSACGLINKKGRHRGALLQTDQQQISVNNRINRATIDAGTTLGAVIADCVNITRFGNSSQRAGVNTGATSNTFFGYFQSHQSSPCLKRKSKKSEFHQFLFFFLYDRIDLGNIIIGQLLHIFFAMFQVISRNFFVFFKQLESLIGFTT